MTKKFDDAVESVALLSRQYVEGGQIVLKRMEPETFILQLKLGIRLERFVDGSVRTEKHETQYSCSDEAAETLFGICENNTAAFDLCKRIAAHGLLLGQPLPPALQRFAGNFLADLIKRPNGTRRSITWSRNIYLLTLVRMAQKRCGLEMTRSDGGHNEISACDAVSLGLARNGHSVSYRAIKELCVGSKREQKELRSDFNDWVLAIVSALESGEISERQLEGSWLLPAIL